jgi:beta-glucanase (GH16 family)
LLPAILVAASVACAIRAEPPPAPEGYVWQVNEAFTDEFDGDSLDTEKWHDHHPFWEGRPPARFMPSSVSLADGHLVLRAGLLDEPMGEFTVAGGAVVSKSLEAFYGYYEVRMKASLTSMSSTFWFSNQGAPFGDGMIAHELDVNEAIGAPNRFPGHKDQMHSNTHSVYWGPDGKETAEAKGAVDLVPPAGEAFHVYGAWWVDANTVDFYLNDEYVYTIHPDTRFSDTPFDRPMHLNLVMETYDWQEPPTREELTDETRNATRYDWVRAWVLVKESDAEGEG